MFEIKVPEFGESIQEVQVAVWMKQPGDWVDQDEDIVELESEKASQALSAPQAGILQKILVPEGEFAQVGDVLCTMEAGEKPASSGAAATSSAAAAAAGSTAVAAPPAKTDTNWIMPAAERVLSEYKISADAITPTGPGGRLQKEDVMKYIEAKGLRPGGATTAAAATAASAVAATAARSATPPASPGGVEEFNEQMESLHFSREESSKPMSMIRRTIASRLVEAQTNAALLTTFNEIDMKPVMDLRKKYKEAFHKKHGVKLGFMSFFAKASVEALKRFPSINCEIRGTDVISVSYTHLTLPTIYPV